jgi:hypothetical protein
VKSTEDICTALRKMLAPLSPRRRRWQRFLRKLQLNPARLPRPLLAPPPRDFIICGAPRTGTTLLAAALFQPPETITVMEPWDGMRQAPAELFASLRDEIVTTNRLRRGKLDIAGLLEAGVVRWCDEGTESPPLAANEDFLLGVKWPTYWRYLELLPETRFLVCLRDPLEVINSFKRTGGRLGDGLEYDIAFNRELNAELEAATDDPAVRRALLYERIHARILPWLSRPNVFAVRYERWFTEPAELLGEIGRFLEVDLARPPAAIRKSPYALGLTREYCASAAALDYRVEA